METVLKKDFVRIPKSIYYNEDFTIEDILLISNIISLEVVNRKCYYSYSQWANILRCSMPKVNRVINKLKQQDWIYWEMGNTGKSNTYHTTSKLHKLITEENIW